MKPNKKSIQLNTRAEAVEAFAKLIAETRLSGESAIHFHSPHLDTLPDIGRMPKLRVLDLAGTRVRDLSPISVLTSLRDLDISGIKISDLTPITKLERLSRLVLKGTAIPQLDQLSAIRYLRTLIVRDCPLPTLWPISGMRLKWLDIGGTDVSDLTPLGSIKYLENLSIDGTLVTSLSGLERLRHIEGLNISRTDISSLSPLQNYRRLMFLDLSNTKVTDLSPLKLIESFIRKPKAYSAVQFGDDHRIDGLVLNNVSLDDSNLRKLERLENPEKTEKIISYLRESAGLPPIDKNSAKSWSEIEPLRGINSPYEFTLTKQGRVGVRASPANAPVFPSSASERSHSDRLQTCRVLANDLIEELDRGNYQVRSDYKSCLNKYVTRLPADTEEGNFLLADAESRTLRNLFAAEAEILSPAFASKLKTFLEQHMGLRVFYPDITEFYRDVQTGRMRTPLSLDAVRGFARAIEDSTPEVFEPSVSEEIDAAAAVPPTVVPALERSEKPPSSEGSLLPPNDPLGEMDNTKAWDFTMAGAANGVWKAFLQGAKISGAVTAWQRAGTALAPYAEEILDWLHQFTGH